MTTQQRTPLLPIAIALIAIVAIGLRLFQITSLPPSDTEALGIGAPNFLPVSTSLTLTRGIAAALSLAALLVIAWTSLRAAQPDDRRLALIAPLLLALDPLAIAAARESPRAGALTLLGALLVALIAQQPAPRPRARVAVVALLISMGAIGVFLALLRTSGDAPIPVDAAVAAWFDEHSGSHGAFFGWLARRLATLHHLGYAIVPLALGSIFTNRRCLALFLVALGLDLLGVDLLFGDGLRTIDHALLSPVVAWLAASTLAGFRKQGAELGVPWPAILGAIAIVLAVNAPVLLSDALTGMRFPWHRVRAYLDADKSLDRAKTTFYTSTPATAKRALGDSFHVASMQIGDPLFKLADGSPSVFLIPVNVDQAHGPNFTRSDPQLGFAESVKLADEDIIAKRFDLYRFEVRIFRPR